MYALDQGVKMFDLSLAHLIDCLSVENYHLWVIMVFMQFR